MAVKFVIVLLPAARCIERCVYARLPRYHSHGDTRAGWKSCDFLRSFSNYYP